LERIFNIALALLILIVVAFIFTFIVYAVFWLIGKLLRRILSIPRIQSLLARTQQRLHEWMQKNSERIEVLWEYLSEVLIQPLLLAFIVTVLFNRIQDFIEYTAIHQDSSFWKLLEGDMNTSSLYSWFSVVFCLWLFYKSYKIVKDRNNRHQTNKKLDQIYDAIRGNDKCNSDHFDSIL
jgi:hypothetical protein